MERKVIEVAAGLVFHGSKLLISQRRPDDHLGGLWEFPGGKLEPGETFAGCLIRELREELGIEVWVGEQIEEVTHSYPEKTVRLKFFICQLLKGQAEPIQCEALAWVTRDDLSNYEFPAADAELLQTLRTRAELWTSPNFS
jgi:mutator protein MutT